MSKHRMKNVSYDEDDLDDEYDSLDPEQEEYLEECTTEVSNQLRSGEPSIMATRAEVQEALWHYYNDVEKSVNYLRNKKMKEIKKKQSAPAPAPKVQKRTTGKQWIGYLSCFECWKRCFSFQRGWALVSSFILFL